MKQHTRKGLATQRAKETYVLSVSGKTVSTVTCSCSPEGREAKGAVQ